MNPFNTSASDGSQMFTTALVIDNNDPDGQGRVKIQYPWDSDYNASYWARVVTFMSGDDFGSFFLPEIDDEVLVAFLGGSIERPIVIGSLWNKEHTPPSANEDGENNVRVIKSRSGHELVFNDKEGEQKVEIKHSNGHKITLSNGVKVESSGTMIELDEDSNITIESDMDVTVKSGKNIVIEGGMEISMKGSNITIEADAILTLKGSIVNIN